MISLKQIIGSSSRLGAVLLYFSIAMFGISPVTANAAEFVTNGNFTATTLSSPGGYICQVGTTCTSNVTGWTSTCNQNKCGTPYTNASLLFAGTNGSAYNSNVGLYGTIPDAPLGGNTIAIDGGGTYGASISQAINNLVVGSTYTLNFEQAAAQQKPAAGATTEQWAVSFGSVTQDSALMMNPSQQVQPWNAQSMTFIASSANEILTFLAVGTPQGSPPVVLLGNVSLSGAAVPEPATWALMLCGLGLTGVAMRRRMVLSPARAA